MDEETVRIGLVSQTTSREVFDEFHDQAFPAVGYAAKIMGRFAPSRRRHTALLCFGVQRGGCLETRVVSVNPDIRGVEQAKEGLNFHGSFRIDGVVATPIDTVFRGQTVSYDAGEFEEPSADCTISIIYEDRWLLAVNKPGNLLIHRAGK